MPRARHEQQHGRQPRQDLLKLPALTACLLTILISGHAVSGQLQQHRQQVFDSIGDRKPLGFTVNQFTPMPAPAPAGRPDRGGSGDPTSGQRQLGSAPQSFGGSAGQQGPPAFGEPNGFIEKVIYPSDSFDQELYHNGTSTASNVIEHKRFVESVSSRCMASTILEDPMVMEPTFIVIRPHGETRLRATSHPSRILAAGYEPHRPTILLIHGYTQSYPDTTWLRQSRALFERHQRLADFNLIIMDWSAAAGGSYAQAAAMASGMGSFLANFLMKLYDDLGADRLNIHLIGHSLGAHLAGFAGKRIRPRIGRISALDPAGPCFGKILSNSPTDRLSPDDAIEVDVYHYDDDFLGLPGQHGQFDVYVNGGSNQPGCSGNINTMFGAMVTMIFRLNRALSESHTRSTEVATVPLSDNYCQLVAYECRDYSSFQLGECAKCDDFNAQCFLMSFSYQYGNREDPNQLMMDHQLKQQQQHHHQQHQQRQQQRPPLFRPTALRTSFPGKKLYISTSEKEVYCLQHYQVLIKFEPTPEMAQQAKKQKWRLHLDVQNDLNQRMNFTAHNQMAPNVFSFLLLSDGRPARIRSAELQARTSGGAFVPLAGVFNPRQQQQQQKASKNNQQQVFQVFAIDVQFMSDFDPHVRRLMSSRLCPTEQLNNIAVDSSSSSQASSSSSASEWLHFDECL